MMIKIEKQKKTVKMAIGFGWIAFAIIFAILSVDIGHRREENKLSGKEESFLEKFLFQSVKKMYQEKIPIFSIAESDIKIEDNLFIHSIKRLLPVQAYVLAEKTSIEVLAYEENARLGDDEKNLDESFVEEEDIPEGDINLISGEFYYEETKQKKDEDSLASALTNNLSKIKTLKNTLDTDYLLQNFYIINGSTTRVDKSVFNAKKLLERDLRIKKEEKSPQILIFHTHAASEAFIDSRKGIEDDTIVGVGTYLKKVLEETYQYNVLHDTSKYDVVNGKIDRNLAYTAALKSVRKTLEDNPSIQVVIDLHRDGIAENLPKRVTKINGKSTAQVMFFNGISRNLNGDIEYLYNPNLEGNLAFSLQMELKAMELYPDFSRKIFIKGYRYNMHLKPRYLLIELGANNNTVEEAYNAMEPLARVLNAVLTGTEN